MSIYIIDTETTGIDEPDVIELAYMKLNDELLVDGASTVERFKPAKEITLGALATHHILPSDLEGCTDSSFAKIPAGTEYIIGHNVDFDWKALGSPDVKRICTLALARKVWPDLDSHNQSALYYYIKGKTEDTRKVLHGAHSAETDIQICQEILSALCVELLITNIETLYDESEDARIPRVIPFGKHKGTLFKDIPKQYADWYRKQEGADPYIIEAFRRAR